MRLTPLENFLEASEVKMFAKNALKDTSIFTFFNSILLGFQEKSPFCYFSCIKKGLRSRMVTKVSALESCDLGVSLRYLEHASQTSRIFLEAFEVKVVTQKLLELKG